MLHRLHVPCMHRMCACIACAHACMCACMSVRVHAGPEYGTACCFITCTCRLVVARRRLRSTCVIELIKWPTLRVHVATMRVSTSDDPTLAYLGEGGSGSGLGFGSGLERRPGGRRVPARRQIEVHAAQQHATWAKEARELAGAPARADEVSSGEASNLSSCCCGQRVYRASVRHVGRVGGASGTGGGIDEEEDDCRVDELCDGEANDRGAVHLSQAAEGSCQRVRIEHFKRWGRRQASQETSSSAEESSQVKSSQAKSSQVKSSQVKPSQAKPSQASRVTSRHVKSSRAKRRNV